MCCGQREEEKRNAGEKWEAAGRRASGEGLAGTVVGRGEEGAVVGEERAKGSWGREGAFVGGSCGERKKPLWGEGIKRGNWGCDKEAGTVATVEKAIVEGKFAHWYPV